jgi:hypothetical protein
MEKQRRNQLNASESENKAREASQLLYSDHEAFRKWAVEEYWVNEINFRIISSRSLILLSAAGAACFFFNAWWWKMLGAVLAQIGICLFCYRRGHLNGYVWGHEIGFHNGIATVSDIHGDRNEGNEQ